MTVKPPSPLYLGPPDKFSRGSNKPIKRVVIHCTVSPTEQGGARNIARYFRSPGAAGSAHYVVDPGEVVQSAWDSVICWHAPPNPNTLGVELCDPMKGKDSRWGDGDHRRMLAHAARLVAQLCLAYDVPIKRRGRVALRLGRRGITGHVDVAKAFGQSTHWDPGPGFPWRRFMRLVRAAADDLRDPQPPPAPKPEPTPEPAPEPPILEEEDAVYQLYRVKGKPALYAVDLSGARHIKNPVHLTILRREGRVSKDVDEITQAELDKLLERE